MIRFITLHKSFFDPINIRQSFVESVARFANMNGHTYMYYKLHNSYLWS